MNMAAGGWCPDYLDPFNFINVMFDGGLINKVDEGANVNWSYANISGANTQMRAAAKQTHRACPNRSWWRHIRAG